MQKLYWPFLWNKIHILQNYIWQVLAIGHDYPVHVDKQDSDKNLPRPLPLKWGQRSNI